MNPFRRQRVVESSIMEVKYAGGEVRWSSYLVIDGRTVYQRHFDPCPER